MPAPELLLAEPHKTPRTRVEEVLQARGVGQSELAARTGWHSSNVSRIVAGRIALSPVNRRSLARVLECPETVFIEPIGAPIPPAATIARPSRLTAPGFDVRLAALVTALGAGSMEDLLLFLLNGDYSRLPQKLAARLRSIVNRG